jgi:tetratricopeptide (TPR) repeat protein
MKRLQLSVGVLVAFAFSGCVPDASVESHEVELTIPTYQVGKPDPNPRFYAGRAYQGAQGRVYPYPLLDQLSDDRVDKPYKLVYLENEYVKVGVLPEIGGRVFEAKDKINDYDFLYRQHVIKPALIGMLGAWISGGIEWNFPHHHRSRSFMPMDYTLVDEPDGSRTVWLTELELRQRMQFSLGITVRPGKAYFEATIRPYNGTPLAQSFLYWANPAVHAGPGYQVIFPPATQFATYHGKNDFAAWPVARGSYRGIEYDSVDLSWWRNHPSPISFFAWNYDDDFLAGYDHERSAGVVYFANHHIAPGKKLWEWGPGPQGRLWDKILTDEDGPYIELMAGAYSDNQPDYSWLQPYESKLVKQYWYPIRDIGGVKNATLEAAVNLELQDGMATLGFHTTSRHDSAVIRLESDDSLVFHTSVSIDPANPFLRRVALPVGAAASGLRASLSVAGRELVSYQFSQPPETSMPETVTPPASPAEVESVEELYLIGQRLEQFHNPSLNAADYYAEALRRDPAHSRSNIALAVRRLRDGRFEDAVTHLRVALQRVTTGYTSPRDGEAFYYLGLSQQSLHNHDEAYDAFYRATWSAAFHAAAYYRLAQIDCIRGDFDTALEHLDRSLETNAKNPRALSLRAAILRKLGRHEDAGNQAQVALSDNSIDIWALHELLQAQIGMGAARAASRTEQLLIERQLAKFDLAEDRKPWHESQSWLDAQPFLEVASEYSNAGLWDDALSVLAVLNDNRLETNAATYPLVHYWIGFLLGKMGESDAATAAYAEAAGQTADYCFPSRLETAKVLRQAMQHNPTDALAHYCLGNLLYDRQPEAAIREWQIADSIGTSIPTVYRNLARAYVEQDQDVRKATAAMFKAVELDQTDPRLYYELDLLLEAGGVSPAERLRIIEGGSQVVANNNDALGRKVVLLTQLGRYDEAIGLMQTRHFRRWEGLGNIYTTYVDALLLRGAERVREGQFAAAIADLENALEYPENLEVAEPYRGGRAAEVSYFLGEAHRAANDSAAADRYYELAAAAARGTGASPVDYYQAMALRRLGRDREANRIIDALVEQASERLRSLQSSSSLEFFTKFGTRRSINAQAADAYYLLGLGYLGRGDRSSAQAMFYQALERNANHLWARAYIMEN